MTQSTSIALAIYATCSVGAGIGTAQTCDLAGVVKCQLTSSNNVNTLSFVNTGAGKFGLRITMQNSPTALYPPASVYVSAPVRFYVCHTNMCTETAAEGNPAALVDPFENSYSYDSATLRAGASIIATATATTPASGAGTVGSIFSVTDTFTLPQANPQIPNQVAPRGAFLIHREIKVLQKGTNDEGYNSHFVVGFKSPKTIDQYHFFAPAIWYDKNLGARQDAIASTSAQTSEDYLYWREQRTGLPLVMMQDFATGTALSLAHVQDPAVLPDSKGIVANFISADTPYDAVSNANWIVDAKDLYGSLGVQHNTSAKGLDPALLLGFTWPAWEGETTYASHSVPPNYWQRRSHPLAVAGHPSPSQDYYLMINLDQFVSPTAVDSNADHADFHQALAATWQSYYNYFAPQPAYESETTVDTAVLGAGFDLLNALFATPDANPVAPGVPFSTTLLFTPTPGTPQDYRYSMGYVGQQIPIGYQLLRHGLQSNPDSVAQGSAMLNFWANYSEQMGANDPTNLLPPLTFYDTHYNPSMPGNGYTPGRTGNWDDDNCENPIFLRTLSDGMEGMVHAAALVRNRSNPQLAWEKYTSEVADWLVSEQNTTAGDPNFGAWSRAYSLNGAPFVPGTNGVAATCAVKGFGGSNADTYNTTNPIRFLVAMWFATNKQAYRTAAINAGNWALANVYGPSNFIGGTIDNPNVLDKVAGMEALNAALALYDLYNAENPGGPDSAVWATAAQRAADYTETWQYAYTFPIEILPDPAGDPGPAAYAFAENRASSVIATGQSTVDIALSYQSFNYFRLYLLSLEHGNANAHYLAISRLLKTNTKLTTQLVGEPKLTQDYGYANAARGYNGNGLVSEGIGLAEMTLGGPGTDSSTFPGWLAWLTFAELDPLASFMDIFNSTDTAVIIATPARLFTAEWANDNAARILYPATCGWGTSGPQRCWYWQ